MLDLAVQAAAAVMGDHDRSRHHFGTDSSSSHRTWSTRWCGGRETVLRTTTKLPLGSEFRAIVPAYLGGRKVPNLLDFGAAEDFSHGLHCVTAVKGWALD